LENKLSYTTKRIWDIAWPLILGGAGQMIINITDTVFLGRLNEVALGASAIGGLFLATFLMISYGFSAGMQIVMARKDGEGKPLEIGEVFWQSAYFKLAFSLILLVFFVPLAPNFLTFFVSSKEVLSACTTFITIRLLGLPFSFGISLFRGFYAGIGKTRIISIAIGTFATLNLVLNYVLVFGHWGFPRLEIAGSAIASVISEFVGAMIFFVYAYFSSHSKIYGLDRRPGLKVSLLWEVMQLALPMMVQFFMAVGSWFVFFLMVENLGERALAISNLTRNVYMVLMMPLIAFSNVTNTIVSNLVGQGKMKEVIPTSKLVLFMSLGTTLFLVLANLIYPYGLMRIFTNLDTVIQETTTIIYIISGSVLCFALAHTTLSIVSGLGKTLVTLVIEITTLCFYFLYTWYAVEVGHWSLEWIWCNEFVYFLVMLMLSVLYLRQYFKNAIH
jgi:putative MATE family efflux protein